MHTTEQRTKEIGIRKVVGAFVPDILYLLVKDFAKWVVFANLIVWPIAYFVMNKWLENFAYRIHLTFWPFLLSTFFILVLALLTASWLTIRAATADPVKALRYE
jgi:putative ABC transport system permease protein